MKKLLFALTLMLISVMTFAQGHLEDVIVEKVTPSAAAVTADPALAGTTVYRVFVDLADGWEMSGVYGETGNQLLISTTTDFYNYAAGVYAGRSATSGQFGNAAGKLDSYITIGSFTSSRIGVLTNATEDTDGVVDGYLALDPNDALAFTPGFDLALETVFGPDVTGTNNLSTFDGAWVDQTGYASTSFGNRIFIGQFTTDGDLTFELNVQIRDLIGNVEKYTAGPPSPLELNEFQFTKLRYTSAVLAPTVSMTSPAAGAYNTGTLLNVSATASDVAPGTVSAVAFYRNAVSPANKIGDGVNTSGTTWSLSAQWSAVEGTTSLLAVATDNDGNSTTSAPISVVITTPANGAPSVSLTAPANGALLPVPATPFTLTATASDPEGLMARVEFWVGTTLATAIKVGEDTDNADNQYSFAHPFAAGSYVVYAKAVDQGGRSTDSQVSGVTFYSSDVQYIIRDITDTCYKSEVFCMPVVAAKYVDNVLGYDMILAFDGAVVQPTGVVYVSNDLLETTTGLDYQDVSVFVNIGSNQMNISLAFKGSAPANAEFQGPAGEQLICVEFARTNLAADGATDFTMLEMFESKVSGAIPVPPAVIEVGTFQSVVDKDFMGTLKFWKNDAPIVNNGPSVNLGVKIYPATNMNERLSPVENDPQGKFVTSTGTSGERRYLKIVRQVAAGNSVQSIVNGADAQLVARMIVDDPSFRPNIYQMFAMDVNRDRKISAGDVSQIMLRAAYASQYPEFKQTDNYNNDGTKNGPALSKDWLFVTREKLTQPDHRISATFPQDDNTGYSRRNMPIADTVQTISIEGTDCMFVEDNTFVGIMLGDADGSYASAPSSPELKSTSASKVVFDLTRAVKGEGTLEVPVFFAADEEVTSVDFALQFNEESMSFGSVVKNVQGLESADHFNTDDRTLRFTAYSLKRIEAGSKFATVRFNTYSDQVKASDLNAVSALVNGKIADVAILDAGDANEVTVDFYPNPANDVLNVVVSADAKVVLMDISGKSILFETDVNANQKREINVSDLRNGLYLMKVYSNDFVSNSKVVIQK